MQISKSFIDAKAVDKLNINWIISNEMNEKLLKEKKFKLELDEEELLIKKFIDSDEVFIKREFCLKKLKNFLKKIERYLPKIEEFDEEIQEKKEKIVEKTEEILEDKVNLNGTAEKNENIQVEQIGTGFEKTYLIIGASVLFVFLCNFY